MLIQCEGERAGEADLLGGRRNDALLQPIGLFLLVLPGLVVPVQAVLYLETGRRRH